VGKLAAALAGVAAAALAAGSATGGGSAHDARAPTGLRPFGSCPELLGYVKANALKLVGPYGIPTTGAPGGSLADAVRTAAPAAGDFSQTNVQEAGVDEPDLVKTDGSRVFAVARGKLQAVDVGSGRPRLLGSLALPPAWSYELLLWEDRVLVLARGGSAEPAVAGRLHPDVRLQTTLLEVDASALRIVRTLTLDGIEIGARQAGSTVRVVVASPMPQEVPVVRASDTSAPARAAATERNRTAIASSRAKDWLPGAVLRDVRKGTRTSRALVQCRQIARPRAFSGLGLLTVLTIDLERGLAPADTDAVLGDGRIVYSSKRGLYVATQPWAVRPLSLRDRPKAERATTLLHKFDVADRGRTAYRASGEVAGFMLSQWSLSEHEGVLRVASTELPSWWGGQPATESESFVTTLAERDGKLVRLGGVGGLGEGERIYAVRFIGDTGYVVTFRQVDPLYTVDLADPERPRVRGELKVAGYSAYLHPLGGDLLLGVGQEATDEGRLLGSQLSVFDVSDLTRPARLHRRALGRGSSEAEWDHHAFLYWAPRRLAVLPVQSWDGEPFAGAIAFRVGRDGVAELGRVTHELPIRRALVVGDSLVTVSDAGVKSSSIATLAERGWLAFS
jgi:uncharacterized secreted protein with C-terminal beta-propeller domain